ncbi:helix-turn-helix domain-containing protein [Rickettsia endosymbiont of Polydrusus tereticollis]|uniref:helix-turn-helix domain-containing protein n=1 Tax=Rickettsia endosymbiont of Polydrusus tereticollis TaxID=3066251 RepID=UPI003133359C|nr:helix-turn-helix domain-containing protein [Rickettsia endosymbiont of Oxypoda opaca]
MSPALKKARLDSGKTLQQVSSDLKIRKKYLVALEEENFELLPGEVYVKGYLKLYLDYLNIKDEVNLEPINDRIYEKEDSLKDIRSRSLVNYKHKKQLVVVSILMLLVIIIIYPIV